MTSKSALRDPTLSADHLVELRERLGLAFGPDTASPGFPGSVPSSGQCAAVATVIHELLGGEMVSTRISGFSHWLNRLRLNGRVMDVDLTGDQFGFPPVQVQDAGTLYSDIRTRPVSDLTDETLRRALLLARRAGLAMAERAIEGELRGRRGSAT